jgi:hypothetical protein
MLLAGTARAMVLHSASSAAPSSCLPPVTAIVKCGAIGCEHAAGSSCARLGCFDDGSFVGIVMASLSRVIEREPLI